MAILKNLIVNGVARVIGDLTAAKIIKQGGVSNQFLKADGSVDSTSYYHSGNLTSSVIGNLGTLSNNISGNAATATNVAWNGITNKPSSFTPSSHTHTTSQITDFPSSLPANGGNADTVDGFHASSFYKYKYLRSNQNSIYDLRWNYGGYDKGDFQGTYKDEYPTYYGAYLALTYNDKNTGALMFFDTPTSNALGHIYVRTRGAGDSNTTYSEWGTLAYLTDNVASASKWVTARTINLTGSVTGSVSIDGSGDVSLATTTNHTHTKSEITDFPTIPSYSTATSNTLGLVKIGYTANGRKYPVELSNDGKMYVHVPWIDTKRDITDSYNGTSSTISLSQKGGKDLYNALYNTLVNGYATNAGNAENADSSEYSKKLLINVYSSSDKLPSDFDNRRITGWVNDSTGLSGSTLWSGITVKGGEDENYSSWQLAGNASKPFGDHYGLFFREAATKDTWRDWLEIITTKNIGNQTVLTAKVLSENGSIKLYAQNNNQLNFGGTNNSTTIYFGYQTTDSRAIPTNFVFGGSTGTATLTANGFIKNGASDSDVLLGSGGHKAESSLSVNYATSADTSSHVTVSTNISSTSYRILFHNGNDIYSNESLTITPNNGNVSSSGHFYANSDIRYKNIIESYYSFSDKISQLPIIKYKWIDRNDDSVHIGSSAQSVMSIIPELVTYDANTDFYSLDYATLGAVAGISACKEVDMLKQKIKELEQEIIILKSKYNG